MRARGTDDPTAGSREHVPLRLDLGAALEAARQLRAKPHRLEQVELEPARDDLAGDRVAGIEPGKRLGKQPERLVGVGRALAEAVGELDDVPGGGGRVQVVAQAEMGVLERARGDDVERAADRQHELNVAERLEPATDPRARPPHALGDHLELPEARREDGQHAVGLAELHRAQDDRLGLVDARPRAHRRNLLHRCIILTDALPRATSAMTRLVEEVGYPSAVDIRTEFTQILTDIETEMSDVLNERTGPARPLYEMLAYHLGLDPNAPQRGGKRIRPLLGVLAYQSLGGDYQQGPSRRRGARARAQLQPRPRRHRGRRPRAPAPAHALGAVGHPGRDQRRRCALRTQPARPVSAPRRRGLRRPTRARPHEDLRRDLPGAVRGAVPRHQLRAPRRRHRRGVLRDDRQEDRRAARRIGHGRGDPGRRRHRGPRGLPAVRLRPRHGLPDGR